MGLTGVIYAIIVACWAAYLVPLALRRHDEAVRSRSIERFSSAMRVLSRRGAATRGRMIVTPRRETASLLVPGRGLAIANQDQVSATSAPRPNRAAIRAAAARRRRVLAVLAGGTVVTAVVSAFAVVPWWSFAVPLATVVGFLVVARRQIRQASEDYWVEASVAEAPSNVVRRDATRVEASHGAARNRADSDGPADSDDEPTVTLTAEELAAVAGLEEERVFAVTVSTADGGSLWDPLPVTLPTYVDKPVARRSVRTIDLASDGVFSSGHDKVDTQAVSEAEAEDESEAAKGVETARVVNG